MIKVVLTLGAFAFMEGVAWFTHKYIMHGPLWVWHESHHRPHKGWFELNDLFVFFFSLPAVVTMVLGAYVPELWYLTWIGLGITLYGLAYFIFHDVIVHRRIKWPFKTDSPYLKRIIRAHKIHHKTLSKENAEAFGFLYAPKKFDE